jgi:hypothetical protein
MKKWLTVLAVLIACCVSFPTRAQSNISLSSVSVEIWPEYDQPAVLVIYHIFLSSDVTLPTNVDLRIPAHAKVYAVAVANPANELINAPYDRSVDGEWATLTITTISRNIQVEYYDILVTNKTSRHIVYIWPGDYKVEAFSISLQQPVGATDMVTSPTLTQNSISQGGFSYYKSAPQSLANGQSFTLTADYQKATDTLSTTGLSVQPAQPLTSKTTGRVTMNNILPLALAGIGGAVIVIGIVGGIYIWKSGTRPQVKFHKHSRPPKQVVIETDETYCNQCGKRSEPGDVFCRTCGSRLQQKE